MKNASVKQSSNYSPVLTPRDVVLLADLWLWGRMLRDQIGALHFPDVALRRVNRRLKALADAGLVAATPLPLGPLALPSAMGRGNGPGDRGQRVYRAAPEAAPIIAHHLDLSVKEVRHRTWLHHAFSAHTLEIVAARVALLRAACADTNLVEALPELLLYHAYEVRRGEGAESKAGGEWRTQVFKPDALAVVEHCGLRHHCFLEIDLSSVATTEFARKMAIHRTYRDSGLFAKRYQTGTFITLTLTTSERRARNLCALAEGEGIAFFRFTTLARFQTDPFGTIWHVPHRDGLYPLFAQERKPEP